MPVFVIALMGYFAFGPVAPTTIQNAPTASIEASVATTTLAKADAAELVRPSGNETEAFTVLLTSYNAVEEQTDGNPHITASGLSSNPEVIAARSVDLAADLPYGTVVKLERAAKDSERCQFSKVEPLIGYRVIGDSMHSRKRAQVDVLLNAEDTVLVHGKETNPSVALGMCGGVSITVVGKLKLNDVPSTQEELREIVEGDTLAMR